MPEMILPGTYITVRDEGLITAGRVVTGNIGIVGTASKGDLQKCVILSSFTEAQEKFVEPEATPKAEATPKTEATPKAEATPKTEATPKVEAAPKTEASYSLMKALKMIFNNGGQTVYAVRTGSDDNDLEAGLALLENELVNIVLIAGHDASNTTLNVALKGHLQKTAAQKRERMALVGCSATADLTADKNEFDDGRLIYVGPGISATETGAYTAAAVAGLLSSLPVQTSPTNKPLNISGLEIHYSNSKLENLVGKRILAIEKRNGFRIVKGITTATNTAWEQITTRRIVDYATYGVRSACDPYIGKLNNDRVRGAMKATIDGFLTRMVEDEALVGYQLAVHATRSQEIAGQVQVTMALQPTFSIDFIQVTMYLG